MYCLDVSKEIIFENDPQFVGNKIIEFLKSMKIKNKIYFISSQQKWSSKINK